MVSRYLQKGQLICLESTTYPGTTREVLVPILEESGLICGEDFWVAYSPEREDPGRKSHNTQSIPKLVGGVDDTATKLAQGLYSKAVEQVVAVAGAEIAESAKLLENIYRAVNIALVNEMKTILTPMGVDVWQVIEAAATKPFGFQAFWPGPGLGGHCIPIDPFYLTWKAKEYGLETQFIELAGGMNTSMPKWVVTRVTEALNDISKPVRNSKILVVGLAYKKNVEDTRESPSFELIELLRELGAKVSYHDPHVPETVPMRKYDLGLQSLDLSVDVLSQQDVVLIATAHDGVNWQVIADHASLVVDTRGVMRRLKKVSAKVVTA